MPLIDFIILGAEKSGTSFLVARLRKIPEIHMPKGEVRYFRDPFFGPAELLARDVGDPGDARLVGIKHPSYLAYPHVPDRIKAHNPDVRMIVVLRDPVERIVSSYFHYLKRGQIPLEFPETGLKRVLEDPGTSPKYADIGDFGFYHRHLLRFLQYFALDQLLIVEYERLVREPGQFQTVLDFLGLATRTFPAHETTIVNAGTYDWPICVLSHFHSRATMRYDDRTNLTGHKSDDMEKRFSREEVASMIGQMRSILSEHPCWNGLSACLRQRLRDFYCDDVERLRRDGFMRPRRWDHFPAKEHSPSV